MNTTPPGTIKIVMYKKCANTLMVTEGESRESIVSRLRERLHIVAGVTLRVKSPTRGVTLSTDSNEGSYTVLIE